jgi:hypothetical protein
MRDWRSVFAYQALGSFRFPTDHSSMVLEAKRLQTLRLGFGAVEQLGNVVLECVDGD